MSCAHLEVRVSVDVGKCAAHDGEERLQNLRFRV